MKSGKLDKLGAIVSIGCIIHCILTPVILPLLPTLGFIFNHNSLFHMILVVVISSIAVFALVPGYKKHNRHLPRILAMIGTIILWGAGAIEIFKTNSIYITMITMFGSLIVATAHYFNHKYICACSHHKEHQCH